MVMHGAAGLAPALGRACVYASVALWLNVFSPLNALRALRSSLLELHHSAGGLHYSLNSIHDFMESNSLRHICLFSH